MNDMEERKCLADWQRIQLLLDKMAYEILAAFETIANFAVIGIQPRGVAVAKALHKRLEQFSQETLDFGVLDVTFHRDDIHKKVLLPNQTQIHFVVEDRPILLVDDVCYTGRTARAALDALLSYGRPSSIHFAVLVHRIRNQQVPIQPQFVGLCVDTIANDYIELHWQNQQATLYLVHRYEASAGH